MQGSPDLSRKGNRRDFLDELTGVGWGWDHEGSGRGVVKEEYRKSQLEGGSFQGNIESWSKRNSQEPACMISAKTPNKRECLAWTPITRLRLPAQALDLAI